MSEKGYTFPSVFVSDNKIGRMAVVEYGVRSIPTVFIIDKEGVVRRIMTGVIQESDLAAKLEKVENS